MRILLFILYLLIINAVTYGLYRRDKYAQAAKTPRVPENILLIAGFIGGTPAALLALRRLRHKQKKSSFQQRFHMLTVVQAALLIFLPAPILYVL